MHHQKDGCASNPGRLKCPTAAAVALFDGAVRRGDIVFTASPFNIDPEAVGDPQLFEDLADVSAELEQRYNTTHAHRVWTNVDVKVCMHLRLGPRRTPASQHLAPPSRPACPHLPFRAHAATGTARNPGGPVAS